MGNLITQFYAAPEELIAFIEGWRKEYRFHTVVMQLFPKMKVFEISNSEHIVESPLDVKDIYSVLLGPRTPKLDVKSRYDFLLNNRDFLTIDFGVLNEKGLSESAILGKTEDPSLYKAWKKIQQDLRKSTDTGLWATNTETGSRNYYKDFRYTPAAAELSLNGTPLLSTAPLVILSVAERQF